MEKEFVKVIKIKVFFFLWLGLTFKLEARKIGSTHEIDCILYENKE